MGLTRVGKRCSDNPGVGQPASSTVWDWSKLIATAVDRGTAEQATNATGADQIEGCNYQKSAIYPIWTENIDQLAAQMTLGFFPSIMHTLEFKLKNVHGQLHGVQVVAHEKVF